MTRAASRPALHGAARGAVLAPVDSIEELIGNTPMLRVSFPDVAVLAKLEMFNPLSNVKDRPVAAMMRAAENSGALPSSGGTVIEVSSGSTGISLAALCAVRGHRCVIILPDNATEERRQILRTFGAEIIEVSADEGLLPAWAFAEQMAQDISGAWLPHQDENPHNTASHYDTTGPEVFEACGGRVDVLVCGVGTGGTLTGVARYLKERGDTHVVAVEPSRSAILSGGQAGRHGIPGIGAGYVSKIMDLDVIDEAFPVTDEEAADTTREVSRLTGLLVGVSSGAAAHAARAVARRPEWTGATVVTVFPDTGDRYLSVQPG